MVKETELGVSFFFFVILKSFKEIIKCHVTIDEF